MEGDPRAELKSTPIKTLLNRLYLLVHPDLFSDYPKEQEVNGKSLQSLMAFLDDMKKPHYIDSPAQAATASVSSSSSYSLSFYLLPSAATDDTPGEGEKAHTILPRSSLAEKEKAPHIVPLTRVATVLHASLHHSKKGKEDSLRQQLSVLFHKCGVISDDEGFDFTGFLPGEDGDIDSEPQRRSGSGIPSIHEVKEFLAKYYNIAMKKQEDLRMVERDVGMHKYLLMTMQRGLRVTFGRQEMNDPRRQLELLQSLLKVVENLNRRGKELSNCTICFSAGVSAPMGQNSSGQSKSVNVYDDVFGRIFLNSLDPQDVWYKVLNAVDMDLVYDRQRYLKRMKRKEAELADKFGFKLLCADHSTVDVEEYVQFLDRMNAETEECIDKQERMAGRFQVAGQRRLLWDENERLHSNISLIVKGDKKLGGKISVDASVGLLSIPTTAQAHQLVDWIKREGEKVAHQNSFTTGLRERETQLRILTKRRLRLLDLVQDDSISREDMTEFCFTLRKHANDLAPLMQRLSIIGSDRFGIDDYGDLRLPWNFAA